MRIVDATAAHLAQFYSGLPKRTCRALAVLDGDEVLGVCGFYREGNGNVVFTEIKPALRRHPKIMVAAGKRLMKIAKKSGLPLFAMCDPAIEAAERFLNHFGFVRTPSGVFQCPAWK